MDGRTCCLIFTVKVILVIIICAVRNARKEQQAKEFQTELSLWQEQAKKDLEIYEANRQARLDLYSKILMNIEANKIKFNEYPNAFEIENFSDPKTNCTDYEDTTGVQAMIVPDFKAFDVLCSNGWTVIQQRLSGSSNFDRYRQSYGEGFGSFDGDFFLGLEKIHRLTEKQPHELQINLEFQNGTKTFAHYNNFELADINNEYSFVDLGVLSGNATNDILRDHVNAKHWSNDCNKYFISIENCPQYFPGDWCNLNTELFKDLKVEKIMMRPKLI